MPEVVTHLDPNPKRPNTGAWLRYQAYALGATRDDLLSAGLTKRDLSWDEGQGHVVFGEGERTWSGPKRPTPSPVPPAPKRRGKGAEPPAAPAPEPYAGPAAPSLLLPTVAETVVPGEKPDLVAGWWLPAREISLSAPAGDQGRPFRIEIASKGRTYVRTFTGDRLARAAVKTAAAHGFDPDDWPRAD